MKKTLLALYLTAFTLLAGRADAGESLDDRYVANLRDNGYKCSATPRDDGSFCVKGNTYVVVPHGLTEHSHNLFYAHGLVGVCGNGASGENYLKNESPTLRRIGAIAVMPFRRSAADTSFPLTSFLAKVERDLGSEPVPLIVAGHSAAGSFLGSELADNPSVTKRVDQTLLIDAVYSTDRMISLWSQAIAHSRHMRLKIVSSTTAAKSRVVYKALHARYPSQVTLELEGERHCEMPKYFRELEGTGDAASAQR